MEGRQASTSQGKPKLRWYQFSLRGARLLLIACKAFFGWLATWRTMRADRPGFTIRLELTSEGTVTSAGEEMTLARLKPLLLRERQITDATPGRSAPPATVALQVGRSADAETAGELIKVCRDSGFEKLALRLLEGPKTRN